MAHNLEDLCFPLPLFGPEVTERKSMESAFKKQLLITNVYSLILELLAPQGWKAHGCRIAGLVPSRGPNDRQPPELSLPHSLPPFPSL